MRYLKLGTNGPDVLAWETFLRGVVPNSSLVVDGVFDVDTVEETKKFQSMAGFTDDDVDGVVGNMTLGRAASRFGYGIAVDESKDESGPDWPVLKPGIKQLAYADREGAFGKFTFVPAPVSGNPEAIKITNDWAKTNIVMVEIPQLIGVLGAPKSGKVQFHAKAAVQLKSMFDEWEKAGLKSRILSWGGSWVPRYIRGSRTTLSNHSWGTAFDINVPWNMLGTIPALKGQQGSVRELVNIANDHGFFWGGHFGLTISNSSTVKRLDGMHFEVCRII